MNPIVVTRFSPWFGRVVKATPGILPTLVAKLRTAGAVVGDKASDVVAYFKSNPVASALTLTTLASLGVAAADLFNETDAQDPEVAVFIDGLNRVMSKAEALARKKADAMITAAGAESEELLPGEVENQAETYALQDVLSWAAKYFGGVSSAQRAHKMMQAFYELPYSKVTFGFQTVKLV